MNAPAERMTSPVEKIRSYHAELRAIRRDIHAHPELAFQENRTSNLVAEQLAAWGIEVHRGLAKTGMVGVVKQEILSGRAIGLLADMYCRRCTNERHPAQIDACGRIHPAATTATPPCCGPGALPAKAVISTACLLSSSQAEEGGGAARSWRRRIVRRFPGRSLAFTLAGCRGADCGRPGPVCSHRRDRGYATGQAGMRMAALTVDPVITAQVLSRCLHSRATRILLDSSS